MFFLILTLPVHAHELRPAYLELHEDNAGEFRVLWKTPMRGDARLSLWPAFSGQTEELMPVTTRQSGNAAVQTWRLKTIEPLRGQSVIISGLEGTMTDALVRIQFADGTSWTQRLTPGQPVAEILVHESGFAVAYLYFKLGIEHILLGIDHLLFVMALLIITRGTWQLVKAITAFTVAHSITLAMATLGFVHVPSSPVEAIIALSIVFVALEIIRQRSPSPSSGGEGRGEGGQTSLAVRAPWIMAFTFGLLHGFGFAGALSEIGLPENHIPLALLFFNIGVEAGQLIFIAIVLGLIGMLNRIRISLPAWTKLVTPYVIGSVAMFWVIQRIAAF